MKKLILSAAITSLFSLSAFAAVDGPVAGTTDSTSATISWEADLPLIMPGEYITFTGANGAQDSNVGELDILLDGTFTTTTPVALELHYFDEETNTVGGGVIVGEAANPDDASVIAESISYTVKGAQITSEVSGLLDTDLKIMKDGLEMPQNTAVVETGNDAWQTEWTVSNADNSVIDKVVGGDTIKVNAVVYADVAFAAAPTPPPA